MASLHSGSTPWGMFVVAIKSKKTSFFSESSCVGTVLLQEPLIQANSYGYEKITGTSHCSQSQAFYIYASFLWPAFWDGRGDKPCPSKEPCCCS